VAIRGEGERPHGAALADIAAGDDVRLDLAGGQKGDRADESGDLVLEALRVLCSAGGDGYIRFPPFLSILYALGQPLDKREEK
jgi:hypothetical protein